MNFILIPFFLAANIPVDRPNEWIFGPVYVFNANFSYTVLADVLDEPLLSIHVTTTMRCRPEMIDRLYCSFDGIRVGERNYPEVSILDKSYSFLIEFSPRGVENLRFPTVMEDEGLNTVRNIVKQLSVGTDLRENVNSMPVFFSKERHALGDCPTLFSVFEYENARGQTRDEEEQGKNYKLEILPLPQRRSNSVVVIGKTMESSRCAKLQEPVDGKSELNVKMSKSTSKMHVSDDAFRSRTEMHVKMVNPAQRNFIVQDVSSVELVGIEPAEQPLPLLNYEHVVNLRFKEGIMHNLYMI